MNTKTCNTCKKDKPITEFRWRNIKKGIRLGRCKSCDKIKRAEDYRKNLKKYKARNRKAAKIREEKIISGQIREKDLECISCHKVLPPENFRWKNKKLGYRIARCKSCDKVHRAELFKHRAVKDRTSRSNLKQVKILQRMVKDIKANTPCVDCGVLYPPYVMDFDHRDPSTKIDKVSRLASQTTSRERLLAEIEKCDLVCANCHRERTYFCYQLQRGEEENDC